MIRIVTLALVFALSLATAGSAQEPYPTRPITIVVAFPPGGLADLTARPLAAALERLLKTSVVVVNKPGAAGNVAMRKPPLRSVTAPRPTTPWLGQDTLIVAPNSGSPLSSTTTPRSEPVVWPEATAGRSSQSARTDENPTDLRVVIE